MRLCAARGDFCTSPSLAFYADRFQGMGCHRARARRGRAAPHPAQGRDPRGAQALRRSSTSASSSTRRSTTSASTSCASRTSPSSGARSRRACGPTVSRRRTRWTLDGGIVSPTGCASAPGPRSPSTSPSPIPARSTRCPRSTCGRRDYAEKRLAWKRRHPLHVLLLRTYRIPRPVTVKVRDEYGGCRSWLELQRELPVRGHARALRRRVRPRVRRRSPPIASGDAGAGLSRPAGIDAPSRGARRVLCVGIGGGGDVVGALAVARLRAPLGTDAVVGGTTWERRPIDPIPGPAPAGRARGRRAR